MTEVAFEVLDALEGFASLVKRSPTLDGGVPVRVAQGCVPLLEGNALGFQVVLAPGLRARRRLGGLVVEADAELEARLARGRSAALPRLVAQGFLRAGGAWERRLRKSTAWVEDGRARVWTGLLVRPARGLWLRVSSAANRRSIALDVAEVFVADEDELVPLVLDVTVRGDEAPLRGEIACLTPLRPGVHVRETTLADHPHLGEAHARFYDAAYFAAKRGEPTKKYRRLVAREPRRRDPHDRPGPARAHLARVGPLRATVAPVDVFLGPEATTPTERPRDPRTLETVTFANTVAFRATFDGLTMAIEPDARALSAGAREVESGWEAVFGAGAVARDRRALWYLTKYFTPHPPGEPHFFVKPFAFTQTPPGWSSIVSGVPGDGYDVLSGVVSTDAFFATPAVFAVHRVGAPIHVPVGAPLVRVIPVPRDLLAATWRAIRFRDEPGEGAA